MRTGELLAGLGAIALLALEFLPWYSTDAPGGGAFGVPDTTATAWQAFSVVDLLLLLTALAGLAVLLLSATQRSPTMPVAANAVATGLAIVTGLVVLYRLLNQPGPNDLTDVRIGAYLGLLAVVAIGAGAWRAMADERTEVFPAPDIPAQPAPPATAAAGSDVARGVAPGEPA